MVMSEEKFISFFPALNLLIVNFPSRQTYSTVVKIKHFPLVYKWRSVFTLNLYFMLLKVLRITTWGDSLSVFYEPKYFVLQSQCFPYHYEI
jgi:hypothetical protein